MTAAERLLAHFDRISEAPDAIASLRRFVLDLAVRGTLVPQDPGDEPASELLKQFAATAGASVRGVRHKTVSVASLPDEEGVTSPPGWVRARLGDIVVSRDAERVPVSKEERSHRAKLFDYYGASGVIDKIDDFCLTSPYC
jgi:type I restriction enzyme, S subunit